MSTKFYIVLANVAFVLSGFSYGFLVNVLLSHMADNAPKKYRGYIVTNLILFEALADIWTCDFMAYSIYLIFAINLFVVILAWFVSYESITVPLKLNDVFGAEQNLIKLNGKVLSVGEIHQEIDEMSKMMREDYSEKVNCFSIGIDIFTNGNWKPLLLMCALRIVCVFNLFQLEISLPVDDYFKLSLITLQFIIIIIAKYLLDIFGRKKIFIISGCGSIIVIGLIFATVFLHIPFKPSDSTFRFCFLILVGSLSLGIYPLKYLYSCEAFPLSKRNGSLAFAGIIENIVWCLLLILPIEFQFVMLIGGNVVFVLLVLILFWFLPETKNKTIRQCRSDFNSYYQNNHVEPSAPQPQA